MISPPRPMPSAPKVGVWLVCMVLVAMGTSPTRAGQSSMLRRSLTVGKSLMQQHRATQTKLDLDDPTIYFSDDSLLLKEAKKNKVSKALRYIHKKSGDIVFKQSNSLAGADLDLIKEEEEEEKVRQQQQSDDDKQEPDTRTDDLVIKDACKKDPSRICSLAVKLALKRSPEQRARIAKALRNKPANVDAINLLYHKLLESAINKIEANGYDETLDLGLDLLAEVNPYTRTAKYAANLAVKVV